MNNGFIRQILDTDASPSLVEELHAEARKITDDTVGRNVLVRGLIEITNVCRNKCYYCGIRAGNRDVNRYALSEEEILDCCDKAYRAGIRTFVVQGGDNPALTVDAIEMLIGRIASRFPEAAITLSLGEWPDEAFQRFRDAGASRYLLRHETRNREHYDQLHPAAMNHDNRLRSLATLKRLGYQTGTGIMVGSPFQTIDHILEDIEYMRQLRPEMIGIGPFIPAKGTPFELMPAGSVELTLRLISIFRILFPHANIPATTALATLDPTNGRLAGLMAGANVIMPNISPSRTRCDYNIYDNKAASGMESIEGIEDIGRELGKAGFHLSFDRGDAPIAALQP